MDPQIEYEILEKKAEIATLKIRRRTSMIEVRKKNLIDYFIEKQFLCIDMSEIDTFPEYEWKNIILRFIVSYSKGKWRIKRSSLSSNLVDLNWKNSAISRSLKKNMKKKKSQISIHEKCEVDLKTKILCFCYTKDQ